MTQRWLTAYQVAGRLGIPMKAVYARRRELRGHRTPGGKVVFPESAVAAFEQRRDAAPVSQRIGPTASAGRILAQLLVPVAIVAALVWQPWADDEALYGTPSEPVSTSVPDVRDSLPTQALLPHARCVDGTVSYSVSRSGTCSHHGGVAQWLR